MTSEWRPVVVIPVYNHEEAVGDVVARLKPCGLPVILVNDGSRPGCSAVLEQLAADNEWVSLVELPENRGKGGAVKAGLRRALEMSCTHALQVDADGQHAIEDVQQFLDIGQENREALVSGAPIYGDDIPASRYWGRLLTHFWVCVNTLSRDIRDSMCGFRLYPLAPVVRLLDEEFTGERMDFDPEIMVRWAWRGGQIIHVPTRVSYPMDGVSHFQLWGDNWLISKMHTRLFFGMLLRLPRLLGRKFRPQR
ncbi:glycosyltransferase family 2 protein [Gilvimarinus sp. F26214L]|uniref:glycosyltransferase family 2 protein n=1 Tax=Gilvimarinus sp. DZF01 TaxID=3461371 RepID=UPI0040455A4E